MSTYYSPLYMHMGVFASIQVIMMQQDCACLEYGVGSETKGSIGILKTVAS